MLYVGHPILQATGPTGNRSYRCDNILTYVHTHTHTHKPTHIFTYTYTNTNTYAYTYTFTYTHTRIHTGFAMAAYPCLGYVFHSDEPSSNLVIEKNTYRR